MSTPIIVITGRGWSRQITLVPKMKPRVKVSSLDKIRFAIAERKFYLERNKK